MNCLKKKRILKAIPSTVKTKISFLVTFFFSILALSFVLDLVALCDRPDSTELLERAKVYGERADIIKESGKAVAGILLTTAAVLPRGTAKITTIVGAGVMYGTSQKAANNMRVKADDLSKQALDLRIQEVSNPAPGQNNGCVISSPSENPLFSLGVGSNLLLVLLGACIQGGMLYTLRVYTSQKKETITPLFWWGLTLSYLLVWGLGNGLLITVLPVLSKTSTFSHVGSLFLGINSYYLLYVGLLYLLINAPFKSFPFKGGLAELSKNLVLRISTVNGGEAPSDVKEKVWRMYTLGFFFYLFFVSALYVPLFLT